ncbi:MAG: FecR domain-containing protein, partial [Verrucomicrobiae bacterium]|nr:FecR domain-containing protein [Verrucomicrobiae bacterium]
QYLDISNNVFLEIPDISQMPNLRYVNVQRNRLDESPGSPTDVILDALKARGVTVARGFQNPRPPEPEPAPDRFVIVEVVGEVEIIAEDGSIRLAKEGELVDARERIYTSLESHVVVRPERNPDLFQITVRELSDLVLSSLFLDEGSIIARLELKAGEMTADLIHGTELKSDFQIKTPTATCSVRGTVYSIGYEEATATTRIEVSEDGPIHFNPENPELNSGLVFAQGNAEIGVSSVSGSFQTLARPAMVGYELIELSSVSDVGPLALRGENALATVGPGGFVASIDLTDGGISELASLGSAHWTGIATTPEGDLLLAKQSSNRIVRVVAGAAEPTVFNQNVQTPAGLVTNGGVYYTASQISGTIHRLIASGDSSLIASGLSAPGPVVAAASDTLYVAEKAGRIIRVHLPGGELTPIATLAGEPTALAVLTDGTLIAANITSGASGEAQLLQISMDGSTEVIGTGFTEPSGVVADATGHLYIADSMEGTIFKAAPIQQPSSSIEAWRLARFGEEAGDDSIAGDLADPDHDGRINLMEYALRTDPLVADIARGQIAGSIDSDNAVLAFGRNADADDLTFAVQTTMTLAADDWKPIATWTSTEQWITEEGVTVDEDAASEADLGIVRDSVRVPLEIETGEATYIRVTVSREQTIRRLAAINPIASQQ